MKLKVSALLGAVALLALAVPVAAQPIQYQADDGFNNTPVSAANPLPISGSISATNPSVGTNSAAVPTSSTLVGYQDGSGNTQQVTSSAGLPVVPSLPTGASTSAKQDTGNTSLATIAGAVGSAIPAGTAIIGKVGIDQTTDGTTNAVHLVAGTALAGKVGLDQTTPGTTNGVSLVPVTAGGTTSYGLQSAASTNSTSVKGSAGTVTAMNLLNTTTTIYYLRMYNASSAPTCSSATGFVRTWPIPPAAAAGGAGGIAVNLGAYGSSFATGIAFCLTGGGSSTDNTNAATGVYVNLDYK